MNSDENIQEVLYPIALVVAYFFGLVSVFAGVGGISGILQTRKLTLIHSLGLLALSIFFLMGAGQMRTISHILYLTSLCGIASGVNKSAGNLFRYLLMVCFFASTGVAGILGFVKMTAEVSSDACKSYFSIQDTNSALCGGYLDLLRILATILPGLLGWITIDSVFTDF